MIVDSIDQQETPCSTSSTVATSDCNVADGDAQRFCQHCFRLVNECVPGGKCQEEAAQLAQLTSILRLRDGLRKQASDSDCDSAVAKAHSSESDDASSCSESLSPVRVGDSVVVKEGPRTGQVGTVVDDDGCGVAIQVALSDGKLDWFGRSPSRSCSLGSEDSESLDGEHDDCEPDVGSSDASQLESVSESEFEQACQDAWMASQQEQKVITEAKNKQSTVPDQNQHCLRDAEELAQAFEPSAKRVCVEVPIFDPLSLSVGGA